MSVFGMVVFIEPEVLNSLPADAKSRADATRPREQVKPAASITPIYVPGNWNMIKLVKKTPNMMTC